MNATPDAVMDLIARALGPEASVRMEGPGRLALRAPGRRWMTLRLANWEERFASESDSEPTIWVLRRPRRAELEALRASGRSFVALTGAVRIQAPGLLVDRTDLRPLKRPATQGRRSAFSDRASLVARWLFDQRHESEWSITGMAREVAVSPSVVSYAVADLERRGLVQERTSHPERWIRLLDHRALLDQWTLEYDWRDNISLEVDAPLGSLRPFLSRLGSAGLRRWAAGLHAGASLFLPHTLVEQVHLYVDERGRDGLLRVAQRLGWQPALDGPVRLLSARYRTSVWYGARQREGVPVVSTLQLLLDLWNHPLRGREQAELLLEKHLQGVAGPT